MRLLHGDCLQVLREIEDSSIDSVVTDPPYGLAFMGKKWDYNVPSVEIWAECLRVLKPGGHLLAFAGTRTQHRMAVRIEDAGFEIRDMIAWVYGSGFPKSLDVSKAIDRAEREVVGVIPDHWTGKGNALNFSTDRPQSEVPVTGAPATPEAQQWAGWGTALKPALEPITMARKPIAGTVAANVMAHGTGGLNVDECRVGTEDLSAQWDRSGNQDGSFGNGKRASQGKQAPPGRWPANLIHDGSDEVVGLFPANAGASAPVKGTEASMASVGAVTGKRDRVPGAFHADTGSAARFFYCPKASKAERGEGNAHPTVKPVGLMRYLCRLVTPPGGIVLDPFCGSGTTGVAAALEGFDFAGIERELEYLELARRRVAQASPHPELAVANCVTAEGC
jgi:hypothetical protein